nr:MAG TPA: hypothetical protein [Caudoviricetes sp.]DAV33363.1 MAG TPA: hypothetical protein [Caudoviricetes sp.]
MYLSICMLCSIISSYRLLFFIFSSSFFTSSISLSSFLI